MRRICLFFLILIVTFSIISCEDFFEEEQTETKVSLSNCSIEDVLRKDYGSEELLKKNLLDYAVFNDYKRSDSDEQTEIIEFIDAFYGSSEDSVKAKGLSSSKGSIKLTKVDSRECAVYEEQSTQKGLSASFPVAGNVSIDVYDVINESTGKTQFVIIPNDKRIGNVLYISDGSNWEAEKDSEPMKYFMEGFVEYAKEVMAKWDEITPEEVEKKAEEFGFTGTKDIKIDSINHRKYTSWKRVGGDESVVKTPLYVQSNFYNDVIEAYYGQDFKVGCGSTALGIISTCMRWPTNFIYTPKEDRNIHDEKMKVDIGLNDVKTSYSNLVNWNGVYDWDGISNGRNKDQTAALLFNITGFVNYAFGTEASTGTQPGYEAWFKHANIAYSRTENAYSSASGILGVAKSLLAGRPCLATDTKHDFTLDGIKMLQRDCIVRSYSIGSEFSYTDETYDEAQDVYYHSNMGWGGTSNGWHVPTNVAGYNCGLTYYDIRPGKEITHEDVKLTFIPNGVSGENVVKTVKSNTTNNISDFGKFGYCAPAGKHFACWNTQVDGNGAAYQSDDTINISTDTNLYAIWKDPVFDYDVFFETGYMPSGKLLADGNPIEQRVKYPKGTKFTYEGAIPEGNAYYGYLFDASGSGEIAAPFDDKYTIYYGWSFLVDFLNATGTVRIFYDHHFTDTGYSQSALVNGSSNTSFNNMVVTGWDIRAFDLKRTFEDWIARQTI